MSKIKKYEVLCGLPGAGKTTYANKRAEEDSNVIIFDADKFMLNNNDVGINHLIKHLFDLEVNENCTCIVDGLFLTEEHQKKMNTLNPLFVYFPDDKQKCNENDRYRVEHGDRELRSTRTINNKSTNNPEYINKNTKIIKIKTHSFAYEISDVIDIYSSNGDVKSDHWVLEGSTYGTCWDENGPSEPSEYSDPELPLEDFTEFINLMNFLSGEDTETIVKKYSHYVYEVEDSESDYYGGCEFFKFWVFNTINCINKYFEEELNITNLDNNFIKENYPEIYIKYML